MKFLYLALVIVALVAKGESATKDVLVDLMEKVITYANNVETRINNDLLDLLKNKIASKRSNVQTKAVNNATDLLIQAFDGYKNYTLKQSPSDAEIKFLDCVSNQEDLLLQIADNVTRLNRYCNNMLAANLTAVLQKKVAALLNFNVKLLNYTEDLDSCTLGDVICLAEYAVKVLPLAKNEFSEDSEIVSGWDEIVAILKIMLGQDVSECNKKILLPNFAAGITTLVDNLRACSA